MSIEELKKHLHDRLTDSDIMLVILHDAFLKFPNQTELQKIFYKVESPLLDFLIFDVSPVIPYSARLEEIMTSFEMSGIVSSTPDDYTKYSVICPKKVIDEIYQKFSEKEKTEVERVIGIVKNKGDIKNAIS